MSRAAPHRGRFKGLPLKVDADNDGKITKEELRDALKAAGVEFPAMKAMLAMRHIDIDDSGAIDNEQEKKKLIKYVAQEKWNVHVD
ncbi:hypothetical protein Cni_G02696 [Canna indica]|uniref:EF-hand domain-containing protein n=1 Tax=Canna indica TaxID=4628 RepID=A0AAQ3JT75_9LILI|nr:hypothetical protein Cni_G02696 [Canna indica]